MYCIFVFSHNDCLVGVRSSEKKELKLNNTVIMESIRQYNIDDKETDNFDLKINKTELYSDRGEC